MKPILTLASAVLPAALVLVSGAHNGVRSRPTPGPVATEGATGSFLDERTAPIAAKREASPEAPRSPGGVERGTADREGAKPAGSQNPEAQGSAAPASAPSPGGTTPVAPGHSQGQSDLTEFFAQEAAGADEPILTISRDAMPAYARFFPARGSHLGIRGPLSKTIGDYSKSAIAAYLASCKSDLDRLAKVPSEKLTDAGRVELGALRAHLRSMIWLLETRGAAVHDPNFYVDESVGALQVLMDRDMVSRFVRAGQLSARMKRFAALFATARANLESCPRPLVLRAISRLRAARPLFVEILPLELFNTADPILTHEQRQTGVAAWKEISAFTEWLAKERLPGAVESAPLGEKGWREWVRSREDADFEPAAVESAATKDMAALKAEFRATAALIAKGKDPSQVLADVASDRLDPVLARQVAERSIGEVWRWAIRDGPVEVPFSEEVIRVRETPAFRRREFPVRADLPGSLTAIGGDAFFEISPPDPDWPESAIIAWLESYGRSFLQVAIMRETFPGRFTASQHMSRSKSPTGRTTSFPTLNEGWPLYGEEITLRGGFRSDEPKLMLAMLADLIRADARLVASVRLHALGAPAAETVTWLEREAYWSHGEASFEVSRLLCDPDRACPALGRLEILALRDAVKAKKGSAYAPREFHGRLLEFGSAPISAVQRVMLGNGSGPLIAPAR